MTLSCFNIFMKKIFFLFIFCLPGFLFGQFGNTKIISSDVFGFYEETQGLEYGDIDLDGFTDIVSISSDSNEIIWYKNMANGMFSDSISIVTFNSHILQIALGDDDLDGDLDVFCFASNNNGGDYYLIKNYGNGVFSSFKNIGGDTFMGCIALLDYDGDNDLDIYTYSSLIGSAIYQINNQGDSLLTNDPLLPAIGGSSNVILSDMDFDGDKDFIFAVSTNAEVRWCENMGNNNTVSHTVFYGINDNQDSYLSVIDMDFDHDLDIVQVCQFGLVFWHENLGNNSFQYHFIPCSLVNPHGVEVGDIDNDSDIDIVIADQDPQRVIWLENNNFSNFIFHIIASQLNNLNLIRVVDIDNDNDLDVVSGFGSSIGWNENYKNNNIHISGKVFIDLNQNHILDTTDVGLNQVGIYSNPQSDYAFSYSNGDYFMNFSDTNGIYTIFPESFPNWALTTDSSDYQVVIDSNFSVRDSLDFGFYPSIVNDSLNVSITGGFPRCNDTINYWLNINNLGSSIPSGIVHLTLNDSITFVSSEILPDSINGHNIYWSFDSLFYFSNKLFTIQVLTPGYQNMGSHLISDLDVSTFNQFGNISKSFHDLISQKIICAYDPNDKMSEPNLGDSLGIIPLSTEKINYTIRFQNTGNDTAKTVQIIDQLDTNFVWSSLDVISSSFPCQTSVSQSGEIRFLFNNISLPDSHVNYLGSQGFVKYSVDFKNNRKEGTKIYNSAEIYFDYNPAVLTNCTINQFKVSDTNTNTNTTQIDELSINNFIIFPNPTHTEFKILGINPISVIIYNSQGMLVQKMDNYEENSFIRIESLDKGWYFVEVLSNDNQLYRSNLIID